MRHPTRRHLLRLMAGASLSLVPALGRQEASAGRTWCRVDPVVKIQGHTCDVYISARVKSMRQARKLTKGTIVIVISVPATVRHSCKLVATDRAYGFDPPYDVRFEPSGDLIATSSTIPVHIEALVPMEDDGVRIRVNFVPRRKGRLQPGHGEGTANDWIKFDAPSV